MTALGYLAVYCVIVVLASLLGGWLPSLIRLTHQRMQMMVSVVAGLMLGVALFHLLPHATVHLGSLDRAVTWTMVGLLAMFLLIRGFHSHQHAAIDPANPIASAMPHVHEHGLCEHSHLSADRGVSWMGIAAGLSLHTLIDGVALGAAVTADMDSGDWVGFAGLGTFLAVALHKPLDSLSITALMASQGWSARSQQMINIAYSLMCPIGAGLFVFGISHLGHDTNVTVGVALAFAAGVFLCISLADLLPEVEYHSHDRFKLSAALIAGVALAYAIGFIEPHSHHHHDHDSQDHSHAH